ncbi:DUF2786 domain-containing protein [bacterium]|nr:DUF2786 domain-containing protein [bacterium]
MSDSEKEKQDRMISKIRKLFALAANDGAATQEAENALRMANALLAKHAIEKHELHETEAVFASFMDYPINHKWVKNVCSHIGRLYSCRIIFDYNWPKPKTLVIGTGSNRMTAIIVIDQLISQIKKESKGKDTAFRNGAAFGLYEVCQKIMDGRQQEQEEAVPGTGIMILDIDKKNEIAVDGFIDENFSGLKSDNRKTKISAEGRAYGGGLNPGARVSGQGQKRISQ